MTRWAMPLFLLFLASTHAPAWARAGYVIEEHKAWPPVNTAVDDETELRISLGGYLVIMTNNGRLVHLAGPYSGSALGRFRQAKAGPATARPMSEDLLGSLLELATERKKSRETVFAIKGIRDARPTDDFDPSAIDVRTAILCVKTGSPPYFYTAEARPVDRLLTVDRSSRPGQVYRRIWPAGMHRVAWPEEWTAPENGVYRWAIGDRARATIRIVLLDELPSHTLHRAAVYFTSGCKGQATADFERALEAAKEN